MLQIGTGTEEMRAIFMQFGESGAVVAVMPEMEVSEQPMCQRNLHAPFDAHFI